MTMKSTRSLLDLNFSLAAKAATMAPTSTVDVTPTKYMEPERILKFNPTLAALIIAMIISFFVVGFATTYLRKCIRAAEADDEDDLVRSRLHGHSASQILKPQRGLDPEIVEALPLIQYKDLLPDEKVREYYDCPVCLAAFDANDRLRLLPECSHAFHSDCIDVWFLSNSTCPLCRACLVHPTDRASREESGRYAEDDEPVETRETEDLDIVEVVISGGLERDRGGSTAISRSSQDRNFGSPMANASAADHWDEERLIARPFLWNNAGVSFRPTVRVVTAPEKLSALASIRRSSSAGTDLQHVLHPSYVVDSEGTQHNRKFFQTHAMDVGEFAQKDQSNGSPSRPVSLTHHRITVDLEGGPIASRDMSSKIPEDCSTRWSFPNLKQMALA